MISRTQVLGPSLKAWFIHRMRTIWIKYYWVLTVSCIDKNHMKSKFQINNVIKQNHHNSLSFSFSISLYVKNDMFWMVKFGKTVEIGAICQFSIQYIYCRRISDLTGLKTVKFLQSFGMT